MKEIELDVLAVAHGLAIVLRHPRRQGVVPHLLRPADARLPLCSPVVRRGGLQRVVSETERV
jgi:hypothetical protein